jgi:hypothetical protein
MNEFALRLFVRNLITEAKKDKPKKKESEEKKSNKKEDSKLLNLKKKLAILKQYRDELQAAKFTEKTAETEVQFADLANFAKELEAIKTKGVELEDKIDTRIAELENEIKDAINTVKEMIGLIPKEGQEEIVDEARSKKMTSAQKKKKEDIVKGMKKSDSFGKSKEDKSEMYATATKLATKNK